MTNAAPYSAIDIPEAMNRNHAAHDIVSGFAEATPTLAPAWEHIQAALSDARDLATEVARLAAELAATRLRHANARCRDARHDRRATRRRARPPVLPTRRTELAPERP